MLQNSALPPRFPLRKLLTLGACAFVHLISLSLFICGVYLLITQYASPLLVIGIILLLLAWSTRPRGYKLPAKPLAREQFPPNYQLMDELSASLGAGRVHGIIIDGKFNASVAHIGLSGKKVIHLGLPLICVREKEELAALIAHELGHGINGDLASGLFIHMAIHTLLTWYEVIKPDRLYETNDISAFIALLMVPVNAGLWLISKFLYGALMIICHLNWHDSQRAEYLADRCAVRVSSKKAVLSLLHKLHFGPLFHLHVQRAINNRNKPPLFDQFQRQAAHLPEMEWERIRRVSLKEDSRLDTTHPPTVHRIAYIHSLEAESPGCAITDDLYNRCKAELASLQPDIEQKTLDLYKSDVLGW